MDLQTERGKERAREKERPFFEGKVGFIFCDRHTHLDSFVLFFNLSLKLKIILNKDIQFIPLQPLKQYHPTSDDN